MKCYEAVQIIESVGCDQSPSDTARLRSHLEQCAECRQLALTYEALDSRIVGALNISPEYQDQTASVMDELVPYSQPSPLALRPAWAAAACVLAATAVAYVLKPNPTAPPHIAPVLVVDKPAQKNTIDKPIPAPIPQPNRQMVKRHRLPQLHARHATARLPKAPRLTPVPEPNQISVPTVSQKPSIITQTQASAGSSSFSVTLKCGKLAVTRTITTKTVRLSPDPSAPIVERPPLTVCVRPIPINPAQGS